MKLILVTESNFIRKEILENIKRMNQKVHIKIQLSI